MYWRVIQILDFTEQMLLLKSIYPNHS